MSFTANSKAPQLHPSQAPQEPTGQVASDSLAAESLESHGGFAENAHAAASSVKGASSTLNTTDTSGARVLQPAADNTTRDKQNALSLGGDEKGAAGVKLDAAGSASSGGSTSTTTSAPAGASDFGATTLGTGSSSTGPDPNIKSSGTGTGTGTGTGNAASSGSGAASGASAGVRPHVDAAPGYTASVTGAAAPPGTYQPKGTNLEDADKTDSMPKPKTFMGDVGGQHDPARLAEKNFAARNTGDVEQNTSSGNPGGAQRQAGEAVGEPGGSFGALGSERA